MATNVTATSRLSEIVALPESRPDKSVQNNVPVASVGAQAPAGNLETTNRSPPEEARTQFLQELSSGLADRQTRLSIDQDPESGRFVYRIQDAQTGETIRQYPDDVALQIARSLSGDVGRVIDRKV